MAEDVAEVMADLAPTPGMVVGMSLGGPTSIALAARHPGWSGAWRWWTSPRGSTDEKSSDIAAFLAGPETFASFDEILERTIQFNPTRSESSLRRGVLHNAVQREDGTWTWRHQLGRPSTATGLHVDSLDFDSLWDDLEARCRARSCSPGASSPRWSTTPTRPSSVDAGRRTGW